MSYILDALKKAEQERGIAQVPTLSTVHEVAAGPRIRPWIISGAIVLTLAVAIWFLLPLLRTGTVPETLTAVNPEGKASHPRTANSEASTSEDAVSSSQPLTETDPPEALSLSREVTKDEFRSGAASGTGRTSRLLANVPPEVRKSIINEHLSAQAPPSRTDSNRGDEDDDSGLNGNLRGPDSAKPSTAAAQGKTESLKDALSNMSISILSFSENKSERFVFINGKKYVEGERVEGEYLIESITPEGAVLSYNGERAVLRPEYK